MLLITILSQFIISLYKMRDNSSSILPFLSPTYYAAMLELPECEEVSAPTFPS